ncbi:39S ribosomal protein L54, mitochondrial [Trichoplax sp. H2]|uniref:Large ribosomal subunit protein mL54 n=1 Tax=Trichoplax adhaerens TaxID=10228 RepID=B3S7X5_TRIAD|nr:hypothetical protein TRIADDRAFT_60330 [Trichoplax adhaerens]EDV21091.1 hypothetical protein TRIADDRAFT_60330 [Trichoplax adhaerens]RDD36957.1 39S ribosomal protein L54, mitochondrial [Trichoplax sp. H2]|eukprot:XP_002116421.1 hypothetical protein TRIADDRAFT_60330 [Trichoplax adhaerens]
MAASACAVCFTLHRIRPLPISLLRGINAAQFASKAGKPESKKKSKGKRNFRRDEPAATVDLKMPSELKDICKGANYFKEGEDPTILDDSQYPEWLWDLDKPKASLSQLETGSRAYFRKLNKIKIKSENLMKKQTGF